MPLTLNSRFRSQPLVSNWLNSLNVKSRLILPLFAHLGKQEKITIHGFPEVFRYSISAIAKKAQNFYKNGGRAIFLFGVPLKKDSNGTESYSDQNAVTQAIRAIKKKCPKLIVITDVCLCAYTNHGHCFITNSKFENNNQLTHLPIDLKSTLNTLGKIALAHAQAGADFVAPSSMTAGRVKSIRQTLDTNGFKQTLIFDYSAKFCSAFFGPFRTVANSAPAFGDRSNYQIAPNDSKRALVEIQKSIKEGADILMIKPALPYLDIIAQARKMSKLPLAAYQVSGEYAMLKSASKAKILDEKKALVEIFTSIYRSGADLIITYFADKI